MPDLSADAVATWLQQHEPVLAAELRASPLTADEHERVLPAILRLGRLMDHAQDSAAPDLRAWITNPEIVPDARQLLAQIGPGRRLRLLHWLAEATEPEGFADALIGRDHSEAARFLRSEIQTLHRRTLLDRMFSPERIAALLAACDAAL
jgi:hypothetical protein